MQLFADPLFHVSDGLGVHSYNGAPFQLLDQRARDNRRRELKHDTRGQQNAQHGSNETRKLLGRHVTVKEGSTDAVGHFLFVDESAQLVHDFKRALVHGCLAPADYICVLGGWLAVPLDRTPLEEVSRSVEASIKELPGDLTRIKLAYFHLRTRFWVTHMFPHRACDGTYSSCVASDHGTCVWIAKVQRSLAQESSLLANAIVTHLKVGAPATRPFMKLHSLSVSETGDPVLGPQSIQFSQRQALVHATKRSVCLNEK